MSWQNIKKKKQDMDLWQIKFKVDMVKKKKKKIFCL